ncbi:DUF2213 domain-containing protein [Gibbsiella quercinecans]|uniref:DUF2213 domain-containing protein n=1 Tax=Gibbsiella quercinecans TaxID=929813 RepID=UPI00242A35D1|nr:DUF2213 domain-containing protein [Gibbsiella quercinecans]
MEKNKKAVQRFDTARVKATFDENGFLIDTPIVARIGAQSYEAQDGEKIEFRPASEVFNDDSLSTFQGKPVTLGHVFVTSKNAKDVVVGACSGPGERDGIGVAVPITIYDDSAIGEAKKGNAAEISVGYTTYDIDNPGWGNNATGEYFFDENLPDGFIEMISKERGDWVRFDSVQTNIRVNHVALVFRGRAKIAKLNLDSEQEFPYSSPVNSNEEKKMIIKLDGVEVEVTDSVGSHIAKLDAQISKLSADHNQALTVITAERDTLKAKVDSMDAKIAEAVKAAKLDAQNLATLTATAKEAGIKVDGLDAKGIKIAYVAKFSNLDVKDKADAYIDAAFDVALQSDKMAQQRIDASGNGGEGGKQKEDGADEIPNPQARFRK